MAKQVIILDTNVSDGGLVAVRTAFWVPIAAGQEVAIPSLASSAWRNASGEEIAALQAGTVLEEVRQFIFGRSLGIDDIHKLLQIAYQDRLEYFASIPQRGKFYGAFLDDGTWTDKAGKA